MNPELSARLKDPIVDAVMNRLQAHADGLVSPGLAALAPAVAEAPTSVEENLRQFVVHATDAALKAFAAYLPAWLPEALFGDVEARVSAAVGDAAVRLLEGLLATGMRALPPADA